MPYFYTDNGDGTFTVQERRQSFVRNLALCYSQELADLMVAVLLLWGNTRP